MNIEMLIVQAVTNLEFKPSYDYSGRGMYGETCFGFVVEGSALAGYASFIQELADLQTNLEEIRTVLEWVTDVRSDSLGLSTIVYFPNLQIGEPDFW